jgi:transposase
VLADRGYDSKAVREGISARGFEPRVSVRNRPGEGRKRDSLARERAVIERTFAWLGSLRRLATRWERDDELYLAFLLLGCAVVCWRHLSKAL